jgi:hypothetical protein
MNDERRGAIAWNLQARTIATAVHDRPARLEDLLSTPGYAIDER